jgi:hypothetical protein
MEVWRPTLNEALELFQQERWEEALNKFLLVRDQIAPPSVDVQYSSVSSRLVVLRK